MLAMTAALCMLLGVVLAGCGGGGESEPTPAPTTAPTPAPPISADEWASVRANFLSAWSSQDARTLIGMFATEWSIRERDYGCGVNFHERQYYCNLTLLPTCTSPSREDVTRRMFTAEAADCNWREPSIVVSKMVALEMDVIETTEDRYIWSVWRNETDGTLGAVSSLTFFNQGGLISDTMNRQWFFEPAENQSSVAADNERARTAGAGQTCTRVKNAWDLESLDNFMQAFTDDAEVSMYDGLNETYTKYNKSTLVDFWNDYFMAHWIQLFEIANCVDTISHGLGYSELTLSSNSPGGYSAASMQCVIPVVRKLDDFIRSMHCAVFFFDGMQTDTPYASMQAWDMPTSRVAMLT